MFLHWTLLFSYGYILLFLCLVCDYFITGKYPFFGRADILEQTKIEVVPDQPIDYCWEGRGFKVHIPAGAISTKGSVTACIQASLSGEYELPEDTVLVSGVYWLSLDPPVERFTEKVTLTLSTVPQTMIHDCMKT